MKKISATKWLCFVVGATAFDARNANAATDGVVSSTIDGTYVIGPDYGIGPDYTADPATKPCIDCEHGFTFDLQMPFKDSAYYNCDPEENPALKGNCSKGFCGQMDETQTSRQVRVWIPPSYNDGDETAVMVSLDYNIGWVEPLLSAPSDVIFPDPNLYSGINYQGINIFENLMGADNDERSLPSFIVIEVAHNVADSLESGLTRYPECNSGGGTERSNQYVVMSDKYARYIDDEVFTFVTNHPEIKSKYPNLRITDDPAGRAVFGTSDSGVAAFQMAFFRPDLFGIVIAYSASFVYRNGTPAEISKTYPLAGADFWVPKPKGKDLIRSEPKKDIRIFLGGVERDYGTPNQTDCDKLGLPIVPPLSEYGDWTVGNNETAKALISMGYDTRYAYGLRACHVDIRMVVQDMANSMVWAWAKWKKKQSTTTKSAKKEAKKGPKKGSKKGSKKGAKKGSKKVKKSKTAK